MPPIRSGTGKQARSWTANGLAISLVRWAAPTPWEQRRPTGNYGTYHGSTSTSQTAIYRVYETFIIEGETYTYVAQERLRWRWSKPANLTVNGPVRYAVEKRKLYVIDDDGKEHEMEVVKRILRQPKPAKTAH